MSIFFLLLKCKNKMLLRPLILFRYWRFDNSDLGKNHVHNSFSYFFNKSSVIDLQLTEKFNTLQRLWMNKRYALNYSGSLTDYEKRSPNPINSRPFPMVIDKNQLFAILHVNVNFCATCPIFVKSPRLIRAPNFGSDSMTKSALRIEWTLSHIYTHF